ncbi:MAG TPA: methionyl-tRNA formyltransferase [Dongiaceae bacterium]|nr:methionyl-tRNA formyltransferase [Dongiaceae bacterium]
MGTAELSCVSLQALLESDRFDVAAVVTQPDRPKGRDLKLTPPPVKELALGAGRIVFQPARARDETFVSELRALAPDLIVVAAYGQILPQALLDVPRFGCLNVHTSLLPRHRGAAPIQWAILKDDLRTGVTIMKMDAGLDTGDILSQEGTPIGEEDTAESLYDRLGRMGAGLLVRTIPDYVAGKIQPRPQPAEGVTHAPKIKKTDGAIEWSQAARAIWNRVRALTPWPGAFTQMPGKPPPMVKLWQARVEAIGGPASASPGHIMQADKAGIVVACGQQALRILVLQLEGGRRLTAQEFLAGHLLVPGQRLGPAA